MWSTGPSKFLATKYRPEDVMETFSEQRERGEANWAAKLQ